MSPRTPATQRPASRMSSQPWICGPPTSRRCVLGVDLQGAAREPVSEDIQGPKPERRDDHAGLGLLGGVQEHLRGLGARAGWPGAPVQGLSGGCVAASRIVPSSHES